MPLQHIYGVLNNGVHFDVSNTERGAKQYATLNGFDTITCRYNCGYNAAIIAKKENGKWKPVINQ